MRSVRDRYMNDPSFRALVEMMAAHIMNCEYTPSEMREAALMASIKSEELNVRRCYIISEQCEQALGVLHRFVCEEKPCDHSWTTNVFEQDGNILQRCEKCGAGRTKNGIWLKNNKGDL